MTTPEESKDSDAKILVSELAVMNSVKQRIAGLRYAMVGAAAAGFVTSFVVWFYTILGASISLTFDATHTYTQALSFAILAFLPYLTAIAFLSYRVNKHVRRLSRGKYEPPPVEEDY